LNSTNERLNDMRTSKRKASERHQSAPTINTPKLPPTLEQIRQRAHEFDLAKLFWRDFPQGGRIALVVRWDQSRLAKLLEMLVRTLGMWLTVFVSEEQGEAWVLEGTQDEHAVEAFAQ